jgi:hypothetical protein
MKRKLVSLALATAMVLGGTFTAFADDEATPTSVTITGPAAETGYESKVTVSTDLEVPEVKITVPTTANITLNPYSIEIGDDKDTSTIVMEKGTITNESNVPIAVTAAVKGTAPKDVTLATAALKGTETTKSVFMYLALYKDGKVPDYDSKATDQIVVGTKEVSKTITTLGIKDADDASCDYTFAGSCASNAAKAWTAADKVDVTLTWTFMPTANKASESK